MYVQKLNEEANKQNSPIITLFPSSLSVSYSPTEETYSLSGIQMNNFFATAKEVKPDGEVIMTENDDYRIMYFPQREYFLISIYSSPFQEIKNSAEESFIQILGIKQEDLCKLNVSITTPEFANPDEAGINYQLSFCEE